MDIKNTFNTQVDASSGSEHRSIPFSRGVEMEFVQLRCLFIISKVCTRSASLGVIPARALNWKLEGKARMEM